MPLFGSKYPPITFTDTAISDTEVEATQKKLNTLTRSRPGKGGVLGGLFLALLAMGALIAFVVIMLWGGYNFATTGKVIPPKPSPTALAESPTKTPTPSASPAPTFTPTNTPIPQNRLSLADLKPVRDLFQSPVALPDLPDPALDLVASLGLTQTISLTEALALARSLDQQSLIALAEKLKPQPNTRIITANFTITPSLTPTATQTLTDSPKSPQIGNYELIGQAIQPSDLYSYVQGWIVENDGTTPRPVKVELCHFTGCMQWPRPNLTDVATGYYEFMATPGQYWLHIEGSPGFPITVTEDDYKRYEVSFRCVDCSQAQRAARSTPWDYQLSARIPENTGPVATSTPKPKPTPSVYRLHLPIAIKGPTPEPTPARLVEATPEPTATPIIAPTPTPHEAIPPSTFGAYSIYHNYPVWDPYNRLMIVECHDTFTYTVSSFYHGLPPRFFDLGLIVNYSDYTIGGVGPCYVVEWLDQSGNEHHASQPEPDKRPELVPYPLYEGAQDGWPMIVFDDNDFLQAGPIRIDQDTNHLYISLKTYLPLIKR